MNSNQALSIFRRGSRTYFYSSLFFPGWARAEVITLYAFVRTADDFVDRLPQDVAGLEAFISRYRSALHGQGVDDWIVQDFVSLADRRGFKPDWTESFLASMKADVVRRHYATLRELEEYMWGSAEVVGLMMARILRLPAEANGYAALLGRAMQYINILRDIGADQALGRTYVPQELLDAHGLSDLSPETVRAQPRAFGRLMEAEVARYLGWQTQAELGFQYLPSRALVAIRLASDMYRWTAQQISRRPLLVLERSVRPSIGRILTRGVWLTAASARTQPRRGAWRPHGAARRPQAAALSGTTPRPAKGPAHQCRSRARRRARVKARMPKVGRADSLQGPCEMPYLASAWATVRVQGKLAAALRPDCPLRLVREWRSRQRPPSFALCAGAWLDPQPRLAPSGGSDTLDGHGGFHRSFWMLFQVSRPRFWLYLAGPYLVGYCAGAASISELLRPRFAAHLLYFLWPANLFLYATNDLADADTDRFNPKKGTREHYLRPEERGYLAVAALLGGLIGAGLAPTSGWSGAAYMLAFLALGAAYSLPPLRFKARPGLDSASNVLYAMPGFLGYVQTAGQAPPLLAFLGAASWTAAMHLFSAIPDIAADRAAGLSTTATALGARRSLALCGALWTVAWLSLVALLPGWPVVWLGAVYPLVCLALWFRPSRTGRIYWLFPWLNAATGFVLFLLAAHHLAVGL